MPCPCRQEVCDPSRSRLCYLYQTRPDYKRLWDSEASPTPAPSPTTQPPSPLFPRKAERYAGSCAYLGQDTGSSVQCPTCRGTVRLKLFGCLVHGECTQGKRVAGTACCVDCGDRVGGNPFTGPVVRNLLYFIYPIRGNGVWQRNVQHLLRRLDQFNGKKLVAVAYDHKTDPPGVVKMALAGRGVEFVQVRNNPRLRETVALAGMLDRLDKSDPNQITLWAHAKGVSRPVNPGVSIHRWADTLYETCLDYPRLVEQQLVRFPVTGSFKKLGHGFTGSKSTWHYSGGFWWFRNVELFKRDWKRVDPYWWGSESTVGVWFRPSEAGVLFCEGRVPELDLYDFKYFQARVVPQLEAWRQANEKWRVARGEVPKDA